MSLWLLPNSRQTLSPSDCLPKRHVEHVLTWVIHATLVIPGVANGPTSRSDLGDSLDLLRRNIAENLPQGVSGAPDSVREDG